MFGSRWGGDLAARSDARHQAEVRSWWRDWHRYLEAQLQLLRARAAETTSPPSFERDDDAWEQQRAEAELALRRVPQERRTVFDRTRDTHRVEVVAALEGANGASATLDPDAVERRTLEALLRKAEGTDNDGWGEVPLPKEAYQLDVAALLRAPVAADYLAAADDGTEQRKRLVLIAVIFVVGVLTVFVTWPRGARAVVQAASTDVLVGGAVAQPWSLRSVVVETADGQTTLAVTATDDLAWPALLPDERGALWHSQTSYPLELCLPASLLRTASALIIASVDGPTRRYAMAPDAAAKHDIVVHACGAASLSERVGSLVAAAPLSDQREGEAVRLGPGGPAITVDEVMVRGRADDAEIPLDSYRVVVRVRTADTIDWLLVAPRFVLRSGTEVGPSEPVTTKHGSAEVVYLLPAWTAPMDAAFIIGDAAEHTPLRWRWRLEPPPPRAARLRDALRVTVQGRRDEATRSTTVVLRLHNTGASTLTLQAADLAFEQHEQELAVNAASADGFRVVPGETRSLTIKLAAFDPLAPIDVRLGDMRFVLTFGEGGDAQP